MQTQARVLADSRNTNGERLTTLEVSIPRVVLAEFNTHRAFSRNSASSRAIPISKMLDRVKSDPYIPRNFSLNTRGMSAKEYITVTDPRYPEAVAWWLRNRDKAIEGALEGIEMNLHKQVVNRLLEPWMWQTIIVSSTDWDNFFDLRLAKDDLDNPLADIAIFDGALQMNYAIRESVPSVLAWNEWHLPLTGFEGDGSLTRNELIKVSIARCARVSYLTHDGTRDVSADITLFNRLKESKHMSPMEHVAQPAVGRWGNFDGWKQARWLIEHGAM
jgi:thymidylate synthase ThyX